MKNVKKFCFPLFLISQALWSAAFRVCVMNESKAIEEERAKCESAE